MALDTLIQRIKDDANREVSTIIEQAETEAADILKRSNEQSLEIVTTSHEKAERNRLREHERILAAARREARMYTTNAKEDLIAQCMNEIRNRLQNLSGKDYRIYVHSLLKEASPFLHGLNLVGTRKEDRAIAEQHGLDFKGTCPGIGGVRLRSDDHAVEIDLTFDFLLEQKKEELRILIARHLFGNHD